MKRIIAGTSTILCLSVFWLGLQSSARGGRPVEGKAVETGRQPLLFVTWDTVRSDKTSAYGYGRQTTPRLAALANEGVRFEHFIVPQATTLPTHVSMFTGTHPDEHGIVANARSADKAFVAPESLPTLAEHLRDHGYQTAGFVSSAPLKKHSGISEGFAVWSQPSGKERLTRDTTTEALQWLEQVDPDRPWMLWVHMYDPHSPYQAEPSMEGVLEPVDFGPEIAETRATLRSGKTAVAHLARWREHYDREIRQIDDQLARLLEPVRARFPQAVVTVVGDHGEGLGQHAHKWHGLTWAEQLYSPWVLAAPGLDSQVVRTPTTAADVLPTLAAVADLPDEEGLLRAVTGMNALGTLPSDRAIVSRTSLKQLQDVGSSSRQKEVAWTLTDARYQFVWRASGANELYDRQADPHSLTNVIAKHPKTAASYEARLRARRQEMAAVAAALESGGTRELKVETREQLQALGYLD